MTVPRRLIKITFPKTGQNIYPPAAGFVDGLRAIFAGDELELIYTYDDGTTEKK
jgi:hypothetical protein